MIIPKNIKEIILEKNPKGHDDLRLVKIYFNFPCKWTILHLEDLKKIIKLWIKGEEEHYPPSKGFKGRWMLFEEIKRVFDEVDNEKEKIHEPTDTRDV